jgi:hypothetical protein
MVLMLGHFRSKPILTADQAADFSSTTQGNANWYWGYVPNNARDTFYQGNWNPGYGMWQGPEEYCLAGGGFMHPGTNYLSCSLWKAEFTGVIRCEVSVISSNFSSNGQFFIIRHGGSEKTSIFIPAGKDNVGKTAVSFGVNLNDDILFLNHNNTDWNSDGITTDIKVYKV